MQTLKTLSSPKMQMTPEDKRKWAEMMVDEDKGAFLSGQLPVDKARFKPQFQAVKDKLVSVSGAEGPKEAFNAGDQWEDLGTIPVGNATVKVQRNKTTGELKQVASDSGGTHVNVKLPEPESAYLKARGTAKAEQAKTLEDAAAQAPKALATVEQLRQLERGGVYSGPQANTAKTVTDFALAMGFPVSAEAKKKSANTAAYTSQVMNDVLRTMSSMGGARGFSEKESEMLYAAFPQIATNPQARQTIINIIESKAKRDLENWKAMKAAEQAQFPDQKFLNLDPSAAVGGAAPVAPAGGGGKVMSLDEALQHYNGGR